MNRMNTVARNWIALSSGVSEERPMYGPSSVGPSTTPTSSWPTSAVCPSRVAISPATTAAVSSRKMSMKKVVVSDIPHRSLPIGPRPGAVPHPAPWL